MVHLQHYSTTRLFPTRAALRHMVQPSRSQSMPWNDAVGFGEVILARYSNVFCEPASRQAYS